MKKVGKKLAGITFFSYLCNVNKDQNNESLLAPQREPVDATKRAYERAHGSLSTERKQAVWGKDNLKFNH